MSDTVGKIEFLSKEPLTEDLGKALTKFHHLTERQVIENARAEGFVDCEELIASMLERMSDEEFLKGVAEDCQYPREFGARSRSLREAALAVRLGQYRREVEP